MAIVISIFLHDARCCCCLMPGHVNCVTLWSLFCRRCGAAAEHLFSAAWCHKVSDKAWSGTSSSLVSGGGGELLHVGTHHGGLATVVSSLEGAIEGCPPHVCRCIVTGWRPAAFTETPVWHFSPFDSERWACSMCHASASFLERFVDADVTMSISMLGGYIVFSRWFVVASLHYFGDLVGQPVHRPEQAESSRTSVTKSICGEVVGIIAS